jgi:hypothetical protein
MNSYVLEGKMRKSDQRVQKADIHFLDTVRDRFQELGGKLKMTKTRTKSSFYGYGLKINRETETVSAGLDHGDCDEGQ